MPGKIFYRERTKMKEGASQPHYMLLAVSDLNLKVYGHHMRMSELRFIAESVGAQLVALPRGPKHDMGSDAEEDNVEVQP
jgi:hypothetical protein